MPDRIKPSIPGWDEQLQHPEVYEDAKEVLTLFRPDWPNTPDGRAEMLKFERAAILRAFSLSTFVLSMKAHFNGN